MTTYTTLKEYDNAVRASQRKIKALTEKSEGNPVDLEAYDQLKLAKAAHKFLLACRAKFKETGVPVSEGVLKQGLKAPDLSQAPALRPEQELAMREAFERGPDPIPVGSLALGVDPASPEPRTVTGRTPSEPNLQRLKPTAAEPQPLTPVDRSREFIPRARIIRERAHAGAMRQHKYAADDCRSGGLGYRRVHEKGEAWRRTVALAVTPKFPAMRDATCFKMRNSNRRILVNGQAW